MEIVKNLMVPVEQCATINQEMTVREAIQILKKAQKKQRAKGGAYQYRALLVINEDNQVVGKMSYLDIVKNMEPKYRTQKSSEAIAHIFAADFSPVLLKSMMERYSYWDESFERRCQEVLSVKVKDCMHTPGDNEYLQQGDSLELAIHQLVMGHHPSLLVTEGDCIVGILTLTDVFEGICRLALDSNHRGVQARTDDR